MSSTPVRSQNILLLVHSQKLLLPISLGRIDSFSASSTTDIVKRRPMGAILQANQIRHGGYELSIKMDKRDPMLERWNYIVESGKLEDGSQPNLFISETTKHYSNVFGVPVVENWIYKNVVLYGFDKNTTTSEITQEIKGFATHKEPGPIDMSYLNINWTAQLGFQEIVKNSAQEGGIIDNLLSGAINFFSK